MALIRPAEEAIHLQNHPPHGVIAPEVQEVIEAIHHHRPVPEEAVWAEAVLPGAADALPPAAVLPPDLAEHRHAGDKLT